MKCKSCGIESDNFRRTRGVCRVCEAAAKKVYRRHIGVDADMQTKQQRAEVTALRSRLGAALDLLAQTRHELGVAAGIQAARQDVEPITRREHSSLLREATAVALASDWHIEEHVDPAQVNGVNAYNLIIAKERVERYWAGLRYLIAYHQDHFQIKDLILWLGGDLITGYLRAENLESNELSPVQAIATLQVWISDGIRSLLSSDLEQIRVVCSSGNHGRLSEKMRPSTREANSIEWLLYHSLAREFADEPRVVFVLPAGSHTYIEVYERTIRFLHGDDAKYGGGVGGILIPLYKALARWETVRHAHLTCLGHFHQYYDTSDFVLNGILIGYNPYALSVGARYEPPRQAFFLIDSRRGKVMPADIWVEKLGD